MIATETKEIDGVVFQVTGLDLRTERVVLVRLMKSVGPALATLAAGGTAKAPDAIAALLGGLDEADLDFVIETFRKVTKTQMTTNGGEQWIPCIDAQFKNGVTSQFKWLWFCLEHQFGGFLGSSSGKLDSMLEELLTRLRSKGSASSSPQT